mgnify:CR=1 FL=1
MAGDETGVGSVVRLTSKGWLPYILTWHATTLEKVFPKRIVLNAAGDFEGQGTWTFRPDGSFVDMRYEWDIVADKPLLILSLVEANNYQASADAYRPLFRSLRRKRA